MTELEAARRHEATVRPLAEKVCGQYERGLLTVGDLIRALVEIDTPSTGFGTCESCGATCTGVLVATDLNHQQHTFCGTCVDSGTAQAWMTEQEG